FYVTEDGRPVNNVAINLDDKKVLVSPQGFATFDLSKGQYDAEFTQLSVGVGKTDFTVGDGERVEVFVEILGGEAVAEVAVVGTNAEGKIAGKLNSQDTGGTVSGARVSIAGSELGAVTNDDGTFVFSAPVGEYTLDVSDPNYSNKQVRGVQSMASAPVNLALSVSLSGNGTIEEVVAVGTYIPDSAVSQQRDASGVLDAIGAEQFSRYGDSNAASALKRVTGVSVSGGKYAVVRGLNERYTSILYNGAMLPSPDPTRRVVPLDLFPSGVISSLNVEKSARAIRPADSAGATIDIISREAPSESQGKLSLSLGYIDGTTGESVNMQEQQGLELFGFGSSDRELSADAEALAKEAIARSVNGEEAAQLLELDQWKTKKQTLNPDMSAELSYGNLIKAFDIGRLSFKTTGRYSNKWDLTDIDRAQYQPIGRDLGVQESDEYIERRAVNNIDLSGGLSFSLLGNSYGVTSNTLMLRQTQAESKESLGVRGENRAFTVERDYSWTERSFMMQQFVGDLYFNSYWNTEVNWGLTFANAKLDSPDRRSYQLQAGGSITPDESFNPLDSYNPEDLTIQYTTRPQRDFNALDDDSVHFRVDITTNPFTGDWYDFFVGLGAESLSRTREATSYTYQYSLNSTPIPDQYANEQDIANVLTPAAFQDGVFSVASATSPLASYTGTWDYSAFYLMPKIKLIEKFEIEAGVRAETSSISVETGSTEFQPAITALVEDDDIYPSLNTLYKPTESLQFRASYYSSINRPDFREVAPAEFTDTVSGDTYKGNENLIESTIDNYDLRTEYYFSDDESIAIGYFRKDFTNPIERTSGVISGSSNSVIYSYENSGEAYAQGFELSASKGFDFDFLLMKISGNAAFFDTAVDIFTDSGNFDRTRRMQGQPEMLANLQIEIDEFVSVRQYTLVVNHVGESLFAVTTNDLLDDEYRLARTTVDINFKQPIIIDVFDVKASIKNLTDAPVENQQNGKMTRRYTTGTEFNLGFTLNF
ncbi:MAG: TonB-dependent receptor, partial [Oleibacter sp.]|nr:TonB-dependent receptor [Thalassolituus sp.]